MDTPTSAAPSQPAGLASGASGAPAAPPGNLNAAPPATPPGLAPPSARPTDMEGVEDGGGDDEVVVVGQTGTAAA
eukprot:4178632-Alexandrium_andersonii.AAC.1